jgi:hypothetical protein
MGARAYVLAIDATRCTLAPGIAMYRVAIIGQTSMRYLALGCSIRRELVVVHSSAPRDKASRLPHQALQVAQIEISAA